MKGVSVIVCCYNSSQRLPQTLAHLAQQVVPDTHWEIIVVDNASNDNTAEVAKSEWSKYKLETVSFRVINQPKPGLTYAREKGIEESRFDILIFCDDDNWLFCNYIHHAFIILQNNPSVGAAGGEGIEVAESKLPAWFNDYRKYFACYPQAEKSGIIMDSIFFLYGAGLVVRRSALKSIYTQHIDLITTGRIGGGLASGDDNELCYLLRLHGYYLWYSSDLKFYHFMTPERLTLDYLFKLVKGIAYSSMRLVVYQYLLSGKKINRWSWSKDLILRIALAVQEIFKPSIHKTTFGFLKAIQISYMQFLAILSLKGRYKKYVSK